MPEEGQPDGPELPTDLTAIQQQINRMNQLPGIAEDEPVTIEPMPVSTDPVEGGSSDLVRLESSADTVPQPDQEPDAVSHQSSQTNLESSDAETHEIQQLLMCEERTAFDDMNQDVAFRCEFDVLQQTVEELHGSSLWTLAHNRFSQAAHRSAVIRVDT